MAKCYTIAWQQAPQGGTGLLSKGSPWAWCYRVCRALFTDSVPGAGGCWGLVVLSIPRLPDAAWPVGKASQGALLKETRDYAFAWDLTCTKLRLQVLFLAVSFSPPRLPMQQCSSVCSKERGWCKALSHPRVEQDQSCFRQCNIHWVPVSLKAFAHFWSPFGWVV